MAVGLLSNSCIVRVHQRYICPTDKQLHDENAIQFETKTVFLRNNGRFDSDILRNPVHIGGRNFLS